MGAKLCGRSGSLIADATHGGGDRSIGRDQAA
jgi:hypothetical protein